MENAQRDIYEKAREVQVLTEKLRVQAEKALDQRNLKVQMHEEFMTPLQRDLSKVNAAIKTLEVRQRLTITAARAFERNDLN